MQLEDVFPYQSFRTGQHELTRSVYKTCKESGHLVVEAMSGFGKTAPVLTGSILAAEEDDVRIVYACRTKRQVFRVMEEIAKIQKRIPLNSVYLFSKNDYCLLKETSRFPVSQESFKWYCNFNVNNSLCSYFLNLSLLGSGATKLVDRFGSSSLSHTELLAESRAIHVCPYEVARLAMAEARIIVTTYHYLFDQASKSILLNSIQKTPSGLAVVIDEAHNIRDFLRDAYTTSISVSDLQQASHSAHELHLDRIARSLQEMTDSLKALCSTQKSWFVDKNELLQLITQGHEPAWLPNLVLELSASAKVSWEAISTGRNIPTSIANAGTFLQSLMNSRELEAITIAKSDQTFFLVETNPSARFIETVSSYRSLVLLSATINPSNLFLKSIGLSEGTTIHKVNPSHTFHVQTIIDTGVSTRFRVRNGETYSRIAEKIITICGSVKGGVGIFLPSYALMDTLLAILSRSITARNLLSESRGTSNMEAERIMQSFKTNRGSVLLAVQGGKFSEGEDFPGDQMDASIVVGLSLPPPSPIMYAEYTRAGLSKHDTYLVVSLLPALRKAIQAAGRHIRSPEKRGMVFFLDSRFDSPEIIQMMPSWLTQNVLKGDFGNEIQSIISRFLTT